MQLRKKITLITLIAATGISAILFTSSSAGNDLFEISKNIDIFTSVYKELNTYYVDDLDPNKLMRTGIDAMLESLDPYTNYISEAELEGYKFQITGNYGGIGATIRPVNGKMTITDVFEGFPAADAGLKAGDILKEVDGFIVTTMQNGISEVMRGSAGSEVTITIYRPYEDKEYTYTLKRADVNTGNVPYSGMINEQIGYIILTQFTENAGRNVEQAYKELKAANPQLSGIVLDLRGNPGGLLREAVEVSNVFLDKGLEIVSTKGRVKDWDKTFLSINPPTDTEIPLVVLTSRSSASASEIVAGVIQDYDRGVIIGQKTFGKGLVQTTRDVSYKTKLKLTTAKYYIPSGRCIQAIDYALRNEDGSVGKIPDSLKATFQTQAGRTVYDGGGIDPDIALEEDTYRDITYTLQSEDHIFNFATAWVAAHPNIGPASAFTLDSSDYAEFVAYLADKDVTYTTTTEEQLNELEESAKKDAYYDAVLEEVQHMRQRIEEDKVNDLYKFKDEIMYELVREITGRYYYFSGRVETSFRYDPEIQEAVRLLSNKDQYQKILQ